MTRLNGKTALITGAASGMGLAALRLFASEGARVVATDVADAALHEAVGSVVGAGGQARAHILDVTSENAWREVVADVLSDGQVVDILVNNAGLHQATGILDTELDDWNTILGVNATSHWLGMKCVIPQMQRNGRGSIVNVSSIAGMVGGPGADAGGAAYAASKGATRALTKHAAQVFARDNIRVNSIHPGPIDTGMTQGAGFTRDTLANEDNVPLPPHVGEGIDIAYGMLYLASDESRFVTGEELIIDGGYVTH